MVSIPQLIVRNQARWNAMHVNASRLPQLHATAVRLCAPDAKPRFIALADTTGVPWFVIAVISEREYGGPPHWDRQLAQGDPLGRVSWNDPAGRGPFFNHQDDPPYHDAWYRAGLDALIDCAPHASRWRDWTAGGTATLLEQYNGLGYANKGKPSPYVWSGSDQYKSGKYIRDGVYSASTVDVQEGCMPIIAAMMLVDPSITFGAA